MNLRCTFHVRPATAPAAKPVKPRLPSLVDVDVDVVEEMTPPRGRSCETWARARGWVSED